jgi:hypothetical protein
MLLNRMLSIFKRRCFVISRYLTNIAAIQNTNLFTDIIFYWHYVKQILFWPLSNLLCPLTIKFLFWQRQTFVFRLLCFALYKVFSKQLPCCKAT